jgi:hypothetical protein
LKIVLRIALIVLALIVGLILALMVFFAGPTVYGLRPHAVQSDLDTHTVDELLTLAEHGPVTGIVTYDDWYDGHQGQTGWFLLPPEDAVEMGFAVNGALNPTLSKVLGSTPRHCNGKGLPEKMVRAIEPDRHASGFLGRSTCRRARMDLSELITASRPAIRHKEPMTHAELAAFDSLRGPWRQRDVVDLWPTPHAYHRSISLPLVWQESSATASDKIGQLTEQAKTLAGRWTNKGQIEVRLKIQDWQPRHFEGVTPDQIPLILRSETVLISGIQIRQIELNVLCATTALAACHAVDASSLSLAINAARDAEVWANALGAAQQLPPNISGLRGVLEATNTERATIANSAAQERLFWVTWYDAKEP